ncbi:MAG: sugar 3,4-ketoisomerase [Luteibaculaceae bacterium]
MSTSKLLQLPKITDPRGNLTFLENQQQVPFEIKRVFWTYDVPGGETRGGHAYKTQQEVIIALSGSFDVMVIDKNGIEEKFQLNRSYYGVYLPAGTWRHLENFSTNALALHLVDTNYLESDYIRDFEEYKISFLK